MERIYKPWKKQLDEFDAAVEGLPALEQSMRIWGSFAPAVPALFDAVIRERNAYMATAAELRRWMDAHDKELGEPEEFGKRLRATIEGARRLKGLIDALNREKTIAETAYPEMAGGSLKDTSAVPIAAPAPAEKKEKEKATDDHKDAPQPEERRGETAGNRDNAAAPRPASG
jgi:hypothetical protein